MKRYLETTSREDAVKRILNHVQIIEDEEEVYAYDSVGRVTSRPIFACQSSPPFMCSAMDGYALSYEKTLEADIGRPVVISKKDAFYVNTGDPLPSGTDAVVMIEDVEESDDSIIIRRAVHLWQNVRMIGEDTIETDMLVPQNHIITPYDMGMMISAGIDRVFVRRRPRMLIIPTGKELIDIFEDVQEFEKRPSLIDFNSYTLQRLGVELGFHVERLKVVFDKGKLKDIIDDAVERFDVIAINAGTSSGTEDFTMEILKEMGQVLFHGVSMMPGKPTLFGIIKKKPIFGIPGYPVSAVFSFKMFLVPLYERLSGIKVFDETIKVKIPFKIPSKIGMEEIIRVSIIEKDNIDYALALPRGASVFSSLAKADGFIKVPENVEGFDEDETIECTLMRSKGYIKNRINLIGSHDLILDVIRDMIKKRYSSIDFMAIHTGSLSGIMAFKKGIIDLSATHILDEKEQIYNIPIIKRYLPGVPCILINLVKRIQGILLKKDNPKKIYTLEDLTRKDIKFINRQFGSGTRILFDMLLKQKGIKRSEINGYDQEESSHTAVGIMVKESIADAGIAVYSAARIFSLDFIPIAEEDYDLLVSEDLYYSEKFHIIMEIINSDEFKRRVQELGGYDTRETGIIKYRQ